jgi:hypothetical protein
MDRCRWQLADTARLTDEGGIALLRRSPFLLYANLSGSLSGSYLQNEQSSLPSSSRCQMHEPPSVTCSMLKQHPMYAECMLNRQGNATIPNSDCTARRHSSGHSKCSPYILPYNRLLLLACTLAILAISSVDPGFCLSRTSTYPPILYHASTSWRGSDASDTEIHPTLTDDKVKHGDKDATVFVKGPGRLERARPGEYVHTTQRGLPVQRLTRFAFPISVGTQALHSLGHFRSSRQHRRSVDHAARPPRATHSRHRDGQLRRPLSIHTQRYALH